MQTVSTTPVHHVGGATADVPAGYQGLEHTLVKFKLRRRAAAKAMTAAAQIPTLTADVQIDMTTVLETRAAWNASTGNPRLSVLAFIAKATVEALAQHPTLNASYTDGGVIQWTPVNLGVAVDAPAGLIVPAIRDAQLLDARAIGAAIADLAERARGRGITPEDLAGGTFTISNPGAVGPVLRAEALLNPSQVALLGLPAMRRAPIVVSQPDGTEIVAIRSVLNPSLSFDHRALDGGEVIRFLTTLKQNLETWSVNDYCETTGG